MRSNITARIAAAIAVTIIVEITDKVLDSAGLSEEDARLSREIIKAVAAAITALLVESILSPRSTDRIKALPGVFT
jgi:hypothetical protein